MFGTLVLDDLKGCKFAAMAINVTAANLVLFCSSAKMLVKAALHAAAKKHNLHYSDLLKMDRDNPRHVHEDVIAVVLFINYDQLLKGKQGRPLSIRYPRSIQHGLVPSSRIS